MARFTHEKMRRLLLILASDGGGWREWINPANGTAVTLASIGAPATGRCTVLWSGVCSAVATGTQQVFFSLDDNASTLLYLRQLTGGAAVQVTRTPTSGVGIGSATAGVAFKAGVSFPGDGSLRGSLNGGAVSAVTGGASSGLTHFRIGNSPSGLSPLTGSTYLVRVLSGVALPDADLQAAVNAL